MKKPIVLASLLAIILTAGVLWFTYATGPQRADQFTRTQNQHELDNLTNELQMLRVMLDGPEAASATTLAAYTRQLASLAANPQDTQEHRDLVQRLTKSIEDVQAKIKDLQERRRTELGPLEQRVIVLQRQYANL